MMIGFFLIFSSILSGTICSIYLHRILVSKKERKLKDSNDIKLELNNLLFEKSIALDAINKINQNYNEKKIDIYEKDRLLLKYSNLLKNFDEHILKIQPNVELQDLRIYRNQLYSIITDSINKLDKKLDNFSKVTNYDGQNNIIENNNDQNKSENIAKEIDLQSNRTNQKIAKDNSLQSIENKNNILSNEDLPIKKDLNNIDVKSTEISVLTETSRHYPNIPMDKVQNNDQNNHRKKGENFISDSEKEVFNDFGIDEINKIQKDVLKILQRLENGTP